jgi:hypothetical protein
MYLTFVETYYFTNQLVFLIPLISLFLMKAIEIFYLEYQGKYTTLSMQTFDNTSQTFGHERNLRTWV